MTSAQAPLSNRRVVVDLQALADNYRALARRAAPADVAIAVKADAYGLGVVRVATALQAAGCEHFFVATLDEGLQLRELLADCRIYVLDGCDDDGAQHLRSADLIPVINSLRQARVWCEAWDKDAKAPAFLHIDTGMNRLGMTSTDVEQLAADIALLDQLALHYVGTHFACADQPDNALNQTQVDEFNRLRRLLPDCPTSIANSYGTFLREEFRGALVRCGIAVYGSNPTPDLPNPMAPVAVVQGRVQQLRTIATAGSVGYGATHDVASGARIATVAFGYADGYPRNLGNRAMAQIGSHEVPVVGRVSMDSLAIDVSAVPETDITQGDWVTLIGGNVDIDQLAAAADTISYELLTRLGNRVARVYRG